MACATVGKHIAPGCLPAGPWVFSWLKMQCSWDVPGFVAVQAGCCDHGELGRNTACRGLTLGAAWLQHRLSLALRAESLQQMSGEEGYIQRSS